MKCHHGSYFLVAATVLLLCITPSRGPLPDWPEENVPYCGVWKSDWPLERIIIVSEYKLLFCYIEKVACTSFNNLFKCVRKQQPRARGFTWGRYTYKSPEYNLTRESLGDLIANSSWYKAVLYRDPVSRFVSAHASKCVHEKDTYPQTHLVLAMLLCRLR